MQNLQDIQEKIFFESRNILENLAKIDSKEELLSKQDLFAELADRISFLRILEKNKESFYSSAQNNDNQLSEEIHTGDKEESYFQDLPLEEDVIEEEVMFTNEINDIDNEADQIIDEHELGRENKLHLNQISIDSECVEQDLEEGSLDLEDFEISQASVEEKEIPLVVEQEEADYAERVFQKEKEFLESEERRRKIVEFNKEEIPHPISIEPFQEEKISGNFTDKKFKLASIKGMKTIQSLFADDLPEKKEITNSSTEGIQSDFGGLLKSNIPTDFMEAPKKQHEFKLDFNDKIAFTKLLFKGDEIELKTTVDKLNSFQNIEDARQYLSEVYYQKDWSKVDDYAQRLWDLVESKF